MDRWLRTDEALEAVTSLEMVCDQLPKVMDNPHSWKWVAISLHNALQGYMVLALRGSHGLNVLTKKCKKDWLSAYWKKPRVFPERKMDSFLNLYKKIQAGRELYDEQIRCGRKLDRKNSDLMMRYMNSQPFKPEGTQTDSVERLNDLRNEFIHFVPMLVSLELGGLPQIVQDCIDIIDFLAFECGNILWHDKSLETKSRDLIKRIRLQLKAVAEVNSSSS